MRMRVLGTAVAVTLASFVSPVTAATFTELNFKWEASNTTPELIGLQLSGPDVEAFGDQAFDPSNFSFFASGTLTVKGGIGDTFTGADVAALNITVTSSSKKYSDFTISLSAGAKGLINGTLEQDPSDPSAVIARMTTFYLLQKDPLLPFGFEFGCFNNCQTTVQNLNSPGIGSYVLNGSSQKSGPSLRFFDGRADLCCASRGNSANIVYGTSQQLRDSFELSGKQFFSNADPEGLPEGVPAPIPLPAGLPLLLAGLAALGLTARRRPRSV